MIINQDRKRVVTLLRENAPSIYQLAVLPKIYHLQEELKALRAQYSRTTDSDIALRIEIKKKADYIKDELKIYE